MQVKASTFATYSKNSLYANYARALDAKNLPADVHVRRASRSCWDQLSEAVFYGVIVILGDTAPSRPVAYHCKSNQKIVIVKQFCEEL